MHTAIFSDPCPAGRRPKALARAAAALAFFCCCARPAAAGLPEPGGRSRPGAERAFFACGGAGAVTPGRPGMTPFSFVADKPAGLRRVFVLGGAAAHLLGAYVPAVPPGRGTPPFEIVNAGLPAGGPAEASQALAEALKYEPDLLLVLSGGGPGRYRPELERMAAAAKRAGVPLVFALLPANSADMPPGGPLPLDDDGFAAGYRQFYAGRYGEAERSFRSGLAGGRAPAHFNFYLGKTLRAAGRGREAAEFFLRALGLDEERGRPGAAELAAARAVAAAGGACTADLAALFRGLARDGTPGFAEFTDESRWRPGYNAAVWRELFAAAAGCGAGWAANLPPARAAYEPRRAGLRARLGRALARLGDNDLDEGALAQLSYILTVDPSLAEAAAFSPERLEALAARDTAAGALSVRPGYLFPFYLAHLAEAQRRAGRAPAALKLCERAMGLKPGLRLLELERAQILADLGRNAEARAAFSAAAAGAGLGGEARRLGYGFGDRLPPAAAMAGPVRAAGGAGKKGGVRQDTAGRRAAAEPERGAEALLRRCRAAGAAGQPQAALSACQAAALGGRPGEAAALDAAAESARLLLRLGRPEEAREALRWALSAPPPSWPGRAAAEELLRAAGGK